MRVVGGIEISDESMALDLIHEVGPGGTFLTHRHTFDRVRTQSSAILFDRRSRGSWLSATGGRDLTERAYEKSLQILAGHQTLALPEGAGETIDGLLAEFEARATAGKA